MIPSQNVKQSKSKRELN